MSDGDAASLDLTVCDQEPIHIPSSIQPHGLLLVVDAETLAVRNVAGDVEGRLGVRTWAGAPLISLVGSTNSAVVSRRAADTRPHFIGQLHGVHGDVFDLSMVRSGAFLLLELEPVDPSPQGAPLLAGLEAAAHTFERAGALKALCERAAEEFRRLTGYDRVMIYRFLDDGAGEVLAEDRRADLHSFLNHRFPATDIPKQARALYLRNLVRVIPDVSYAPAPLRPTWEDDAALDMSDIGLRSVSPVHLQYLKNMGVAASASISIVKDGALWGLVACHNESPLRISYEIRAGCRALAAALARQIKAREEADGYRERIRLMSLQDRIVELLSRKGSLDAAMAHHLGEMQKMLGADGVAVIRGRDIVCGGMCPDKNELADLAAWVVPRAVETVLSTNTLPDLYPPAAAFQAVASGLMAITLSVDEPWIVIWLRREEVEVIEWAGDPVKQAAPGPDETLTPRASFEAWRETVHGKSRRWTIPEAEAAVRLRSAVLDVRRNRQLAELNSRLLETLGEKDLLIKQKEFLIGEVNHRVQNSLQLVSSFLGLQGRTSADFGLKHALEEARRRINAVALVHRRLYSGDQLEVVDASRYIEELCSEMAASMGAEWAEGLVLDLAPIKIPTDRAVTMGLILTELMINTTKYAYAGEPGALEITLVEDRARFRLSIADQGRGKVAEATKGGFGSRLIDALVGQLDGEIEFTDNRPGLRVTLIAPMEKAATRGR